MIRLNHMVFLIAVFTLARTAGASPMVIDGPIVNPSNDHSYYLLDTASWTDSQAAAALLGGNLATVRNQSENDWIFSTFGSFGDVNRNLWIGLYDPTGAAHDDGPGGTGSQHAANFVWVDGEPKTFTNWSQSLANFGPEPNDFGGVEYYGEILPPTPGSDRAGFWNDLPNAGLSDDMPFGVVEVVPEPSTLALFSIATALISVGRIRRWLRYRHTI